MSSTRLEVSETCEHIRALHRHRTFLMGQRGAKDLALGAFLRLILGWHKELPKPESDRIKARAAAMLEAGRREAGGKGADCADPDYPAVRPTILATHMSHAALAAEEARVTRAMEKAAKTLPVWDGFAAAVPGLGARSLATIIGEAGDLMTYRKGEAGLWKRMGLAVIDGVRQGGLSKGASAADWQRHGYAPRRRSTMYVIGECLIRIPGPYRDIYLARKATEIAKAEASGLRVLPAAQIRKSEAAVCLSQGIVHRRAQRYMEKRLLRHLLRAWRRAVEYAPERANPPPPAAEFPADSGLAEGDGLGTSALHRAGQSSPSPAFITGMEGPLPFARAPNLSPDGHRSSAKMGLTPAAGRGETP